MEEIEFEAFDKLSKDQVIHLIIWQMYRKEISLEELTMVIEEKRTEIVQAVNDHMKGYFEKEGEK